MRRGEGVPPLRLAGVSPASASAAFNNQDPNRAIAHRRWAMLIQHVYQADPLQCPHCGGTMKIIAFIEARQGDVIRRILQHCGLWQEPPSRAPPQLPALFDIPKTGTPALDADSRLTYEPDPDFAEHLRREQHEQPELPWEP